MRAIRWLLVVLYLALIIGLVVLSMQPDTEVALVVIIAVAVISQIVFICSAGTKDLWRPIRRPRLILPVAIAAFMLGLLVTALATALCELLKVESLPDSGWAFLALLIANWTFWSVLLFIYTQKLERYDAIHYLAKLVFAGSLAEMLAAVPSHLIVERRSGCFVGINTAIGIFAGLCVMLWSFGPGILLLFLQQMRVAQAASESPPARAGHQQQERFQFGVRTLLLITLASGVIAGMSRTWWGEWLAAAFAASLWLYVMSMVLRRQSSVLVLSGLAVLAGGVYFFRGQWVATVLVLSLVAILSSGFIYFHFRRNDR